MAGLLDILRRMPAEELRRYLTPDGRLTREAQARLLAEHRERRRSSRRPVEPPPWAVPGRTLVLVLNGYLPTSLNRWGRNRRARQAAVTEALEALVAEHPELLRWPPEERPNLKPFWRPAVQIRLYFPTRRRRDQGNWSKALVDALVRCGLIRDDSADVLYLEPEVIRVDPERPRTEIVLTERGP